MEPQGLLALALLPARPHRLTSVATGVHSNIDYFLVSRGLLEAAGSAERVDNHVHPHVLIAMVLSGQLSAKCGLAFATPPKFPTSHLIWACPNTMRHHTSKGWRRNPGRQSCVDVMIGAVDNLFRTFVSKARRAVAIATRGFASNDGTRVVEPCVVRRRALLVDRRPVLPRDD